MNQSIVNPMSRLIPMVLAVSICLIDVVTPAVAQAKAVDKSFNRVVLMIDASGSYRDRQTSAIVKAHTMLEELAGRRVKRWETGDEVVVISLDAIPEVIWEGSIPELEGKTESDWKNRFNARSDYAGCTDVGAGFRLAAKVLGKEPAPTERYLMVFSDLKDEPPTTSPSTCRPPERPSLPVDDFPWDQMADVSISVFWMPPNQKLAWKRAVEAEGLADNFSLYTTSESSTVELKAPAVAKKVMSEGDRKELQDTVLGAFSSMGKWLLIAGGIGLAIIIIVMVLPHFLQTRSQHRRQSRAALQMKRRPLRHPQNQTNPERR